MTSSIEATVERGQDDTRLAALGILVGSALTVGFGMQAASGRDDHEISRAPVDRDGRLLRYAVRVSDGVNVNLRLVAVGAAAPWFYDGERGRYFAKLQALAKRARAQRLGLWSVCPRTIYDPYNAVTTRR